MKANDIRNLQLKLYARDHVMHSHLHDKHHSSSLTTNRSLDYVNRLSEPEVQNGLSYPVSLPHDEIRSLPRNFVIEFLF